MIETIARALQGRKQSDGSFMVLCPGHADKNPSLHISQAGGKILFRCMAGCSQSSVIEALKSRNLWPEKVNGSNTGRPAGIPSSWGQDGDKKAYVQSWAYHDAGGTVIGHVARYEADGRKDIIPFFKRSGDTWKAGAAPVPRPLYNLHLLRQHPEKPVLIVEGEKTADAATRLVKKDYVVVTWLGGSNATGKADWSPLKGRDVFMWPDADLPGLKADRYIQDHCLKAGVKSFSSIILPADVKPGWDLADAAAEGWTRERVLDHISRNCSKSGNPEKQQPKGFTAADLVGMEFPEPRWALEGILPEGLNILGGKPKAGKSIIALNLGLAIALGGKALQNIDVEHGSVIYLALEDTPRRLQKRLKQMLVYDRAPKDLHLFTEWPRMGSGGITALDDLVKKTKDIRLVIVDTLQKFRPPGKTNGNLYGEDYDVIARLKKIADDNKVCFLVIHHLRKLEATDAFDMFSGTLGLTGAADGLMVMNRNKSGQMVLSLRGRDVEEKALVLEFDPVLLSWKLVGDVAEIKSTNERQILFDALKSAKKPLTPKELQEITGLKAQYIRNTLPTFMKEGTVKKIDYGEYIYFFNEYTEDTGDSCNTEDTGDSCNTEDTGDSSEIMQLSPPYIAENTSEYSLKANTDRGLRPTVLGVLTVAGIAEDYDSEYF